MGSSHRLRTALHVAEIIAIVAVMAITGLRLVQKTMPMTRADTMTLGVGAKSLLLIAYQLLTEHVQRLRRWSSPWANVIINLIDTVFWAAIMYMLLMANLQRCTSAPFSGNMSCILYFGILVLVVIIIMLSVIITGLCTQTLLAIRREKKLKAAGAFGGNSSKEYVHLGAAGSASPMGVSDPIRLMEYPPTTPRHL